MTNGSHDAGLLTEILAGYLSNTNQICYHYATVSVEKLVEF
jgi:hypothetical protein